VANAFNGWSPKHGLERLRSGIWRAGQALRRLFRSSGTAAMSGAAVLPPQDGESMELALPACSRGSTSL
jgi:hypothetical protein